MHPDQARRRLLLITECIALGVFIASLYWLGHRQTAGDGFHPAWLAIPVIASLVLILSLLGLMYLRWLSAIDQQSPPRQHRLAWGLLTVILLSVWLIAVIQIWSHQSPP